MTIRITIILYFLMFGCFAQKQSILLIEEKDNVIMPYGFTDLKALEIYQEGKKIFFEISSSSFNDSIDLSGNSFNLDIDAHLNDTVRTSLSLYCHGSCKDKIAKKLTDLIHNDCYISFGRNETRNSIDYFNEFDSLNVSISGNKLLFEIDKIALSDSDIVSFKRNLLIKVDYRKESSSCNRIIYSDF